MKTDPDCIFCKIVAGEIPCTKVFEDELVLAFMDISPLNKGHVLVVPKEHFGTVLEMTAPLYGHCASVLCTLAKAAQKALEPDGINFMQLNGKAANQMVPHVHMHLVPRWEGDGLTISAWEPQPGDQDAIRDVRDRIIAVLDT